MNKSYKYYKFQCKTCKRKMSHPTLSGSCIECKKKQTAEKNKRFCIDCGKKLNPNAHLTNAKRCHLCSNKINSEKFKGINNPNFKHGESCENKKHYCFICGIEISYKAEYCQKHMLFKRTHRDRHHLYGKTKPEIMKLSRKKHIQLHHNAYFYLLERFGKIEIDKYIIWFDKKYGLRDKEND